MATAPIGRRQRQAGLAELAGEELVGDLEQHPGPVTGDLIASGGPAMLKVQQDALAKLQDLVTGRAVNVDDCTDAARVVLVRRIVETDVCVWRMSHLSLRPG